MKPDFALDFRGNQITLRHRSEGGWVAIGQVAMDDPDLDAAMGYLRTTALGLSPRGVASKLILPNEAILYTSMDELPHDAAKRRARIAEGLAGRTPYDVADLVYDWTDSGASAHLAVIARETLAEAEAFASQHRFNPVSFGAVPDQGDFDGEVWFGATQLSQTLLAKGEVVERDEVSAMPAADVGGPETLGAADFEMGAVAGDATKVDTAADTAVAPDADLAGQAMQQGDVSPDSIAPEETAPPRPAIGDELGLGGAADAPQGADGREVWQDFVQDAPPEDVSENSRDDLGDDMIAASPAIPPSMPEINRSAAPEWGGIEPSIAPTIAPTIVPAQPDLLAALSTAPAIAKAASFADVLDDMAQRDDDEAPMAVDVPHLGGDDDDQDKRVDDLVEPAPSKTEQLLSAFAARRAAALAKAESAANAPRAEPVLTADATAGRVSDAPPPRLGAAVDAGGAAPPLAAVTAPSMRPATVQQLPAKKLAHRPQNLAAMPGVKGRGSMRMGWILTIVLLLSLAAAAAMSSYLLDAFNTHFMGDKTMIAQVAGDRAEPSPQHPSPQPDAALVPVPQALPAALPSSLVGPQREPAQTAARIDSAAKSPALPQPTPAALRDTGDATQSPWRGLALPALNRLPAPQLPAPPQFTSAPEPAQIAPVQIAPVQIDAPEADIALAVQSGAPSLQPAPRPDRVLIAARNAANLAPAAATAAAAGPETPLFADPSLANARPAPRSAAVIQAAIDAATAAAANVPPENVPPENVNDSAPIAAPFADPALAAARPAARPSTILAAGRAARLSSAPASLVAGAAIDAAEASLTAAPVLAPVLAPDLSPLALAVSPAPQPRPRGLKSAFEAQQTAAAEAAAAAAALAEAERAAAAAPAETAAAPAAIEDEGEAEVTRAGGAATRSVVAKQATQRNAIDLSGTNIVGIFGTSANRYALIRTQMGTFKKLKVGDRFDGGRVAAITEGEVRYDKGGELLALRIPGG